MYDCTLGYTNCLALADGTLGKVDYWDIHLTMYMTCNCKVPVYSPYSTRLFTAPIGDTC